MAFGGKEWGQVVYGRLLTVSFFLFAIINLINYFKHLPSDYGYMTNVIILSVGGGLLYLTTKVKTNLIRFIQVLILCIIALDSLIENIITRTSNNILSFPGDSLILVMISIYIAHIYGFLKTHTIFKISIYMCIVFLSVLIPYVYLVPSIIDTGISFIIFAIIVIIIYWIGEGIKNKKKEDKIEQLQKSINELKDLNCEMINDRYYTIKRYEDIVDENLHLKTALIETALRRKNHE